LFYGGSLYHWFVLTNLLLICLKVIIFMHLAICKPACIKIKFMIVLNLFVQWPKMWLSKNKFRNLKQSDKFIYSQQEPRDRSGSFEPKIVKKNKPFWQIIWCTKSLVCMDWTWVFGIYQPHSSLWDNRQSNTSCKTMTIPGSGISIHNCMVRCDVL